MLRKALCGLSAGLAALWAAEALSFGFYPRAEVAAAMRALEAATDPGAGPATLAARLRLAQVQAPADPLRHELALRRDLLALRSRAPDPLLRAEVQALTRYVPRAWTEPADPDHGRGRRVPVADIAAAARATLRQWDLHAAMQDYAAALTRGDDAALTGAIDAEALAAVVSTRSAADAARLLARSDWPPAVLAALLRRAPQASGYRQLFSSAPEPVVLAALRDAATDLDEQDASAVLLEAARRNPALGSAAVLALGPLARLDPVRLQLLALLDDAALGGSAAQLLAQQADAAILLALRAQLAAGVDSLRLRRALAALQLIGDAAALAQLRAFATDARYPLPLRDEIARGLR